MLRTALASIVLSATVLGCSAETPEGEPRFLRPGPATGATADAIRGGYVDETSKATVGIFEVNHGAICSGSLIAPNVVLTARHCVSNTFDDAQGVQCSVTSFGPAWDAAGFYVTTDTELRPGATVHRAREVVTLPVDDGLCGQDMAILILDDLVSPAEATPYAARVDSPLVAGEEYYAIGYGETNDGSGDAGTRHRRDSLFVECAETGCTEFGVEDTEWVGDQGICSGDSGGPALDLLNRVVGVTSRGAAGCYDPIYGAVHGWGQWLKETALYAAGLGGYTAPTWAYGVPTDPSTPEPTGQPCAAAEECSTSLCWYGGYCSRGCNDVYVCPSGYECTQQDEIGGTICTLVPTPTPDEPEPDDTTAAAGGDDDGDATGSSGSGDAAEDDGGGCSFSGRDPVTPVPWVVGLALAGVAVARRRRR